MKKLALAVVLAAVVGASGAFAQHPGGTGIGAVFGGGFGSGNVSYFPGLSLKLPSVPIYWGINVNLVPRYLGVGVTGDYYFVDKNLWSAGRDFTLDWHFGLGGFAYIGIGGGLGFSAGARVPIGLSAYFAQKSVEVFADVAPAVGLSILPAIGLYWDIAGSVGLRFWL